MAAERFDRSAEKIAATIYSIDQYNPADDPLVLEFIEKRKKTIADCIDFYKKYREAEPAVATVVERLKAAKVQRIRVGDEIYAEIFGEEYQVVLTEFPALYLRRYLEVHKTIPLR